MSARIEIGLRVRRLLPYIVAGLGLIAGLMLAVYLIGRSDEPVGQSSPSPTTGAVASADAGQSSPASPPASAQSTPSPEPTASPIPTGPARMAWTQGDASSSQVRAVVRLGDEWIVGGSRPIGLTAGAAVWASTDGTTWTDPIAVGQKPAEDDAAGISAFGSWEGDLLALGWTGGRFNDSRQALLWRSPDGRSWEAIDVAGTPYADTWHIPHGAAIAPDGSLAVLSMTHLGSGASVYLTSDLATWEAHPITEPPATISVSGFAASADLMVAVGTESHPFEAGDLQETTAHVWTSADGRTWASIQPPDVDGTLTDVTWDATRGRFIAVGTTEDGLPRAWLTTDGRQWSSISLGDEPIRMQRVVAADGLIVATGVTGSPFELESGETIVWSSHDGVTWWYGSILDRQSYTTVAVMPSSGLIVANLAPDEDDETWIPFAGRVTAIE